MFFFYFDFSSPNNIFTGTDQVETSGLTGSQGLVRFLYVSWGFAGFRQFLLV